MSCCPSDTGNVMSDSTVSAAAASACNSTSVFCRGLSFKATAADVREILAECGDIVSVNMPLDQRARSLGTAYVEFSSPDACARAIAKAAAGISHMGRYIEIMPRLQRTDSRPAGPQPEPAQSASAGSAESSALSPGLARILAAQPKRPPPLSRNRTPLRDDGSRPQQNGTDAAAPNGTRAPSAGRQRAVTPGRGQQPGQSARPQPWRDPKNAATPSTHRMPIEVACRICIGAELSGKLSPCEDYEREASWIDSNLDAAQERLDHHQRELACLTQDKALLDQQVSEELKSRDQKIEERKAQIETLKAARSDCRQLMLEISRQMPAAALQGDGQRYCTPSDLKAQIKRLQEVSEQDPDSIVDKPDVHAKPDISINGIRKVWGQSRLILETEKRVSEYIGRLSAASRALVDAESAISLDGKAHRSITPGRAQLSGEIRDCVSKRNAARDEVEVLKQMRSIVTKERERSVRRHDFVVQQHDVALDFGGLCRSVASCGWHFCTLPAGHQGRCQMCPLETVIYCSCKESTLTVPCGREKEHVPCPHCSKYSSVPVQPISALVVHQPSQPSASDWVMPGTEWGVQDGASGLDSVSAHGNDSACSMAVYVYIHLRGMYICVSMHVCGEFKGMHSRCLKLSSDVGILDHEDSEPVENGAACADEFPESLIASPDLDDSVDANRALKKRQVGPTSALSVLFL